MDRQGGAVLLVVLMVMITLLCIGLGSMWLTSGNLQVASNLRQRQLALYVAEAGIERARELLNNPTTAPILDTLLAGGGQPSAADNPPTGVDTKGMPNGIGVVLRDSGVPIEGVAFPPATFARTSGSLGLPTATTMGSYTVWIRNDVTELRRGFFTSDGGNGAVVVRSQGLAPDNRTNVVLEITFILTSNTVSAAGNASASSPLGDYVGKNAQSDNSSTQYGSSY